MADSINAPTGAEGVKVLPQPYFDDAVFHALRGGPRPALTFFRDIRPYLLNVMVFTEDSAAFAMEAGLRVAELIVNGDVLMFFEGGTRFLRLAPKRQIAPLGMMETADAQ